MSKKLSNTTVVIDGIELEVCFYFTAGTPGRIYGPPEFSYEDEPPEVEIESITSNDDIFGLLADSKNVIDRIVDHILDHAN